MDEVLTGDTRERRLIFDVVNVSLRFGGVVSLNDVSLHQNRGEILAVIGPNGAGKTSLFNSLTGVYQPAGRQHHFHRAQTHDRFRSSARSPLG